MVVTPLGITILFKLLVPIKAVDSIILTPSGII